eukprot:s3720_g6.t1
MRSALTCNGAYNVDLENASVGAILSWPAEEYWRTSSSNMRGWNLPCNEDTGSRKLQNNKEQGTRDNFTQSDRTNKLFLRCQVQFKFDAALPSGLFSSPSGGIL